MQPADIVEDPLPEESAKDCAERLAREKALAVARLRPQDVVLGADTVVVVEGQLLGKPSDGEDAARMLRLLSGRVHQVITGVCLVVGGQCSVASETTFVTVSEISEKEIAEYVASGSRCKLEIIDPIRSSGNLAAAFIFEHCNATSATEKDENARILYVFRKGPNGYRVNMENFGWGTF